MGVPDTLQLSLPSRAESVGEIRRAVERLAVRCGVPESRVQDIKTAVSEAVTNAVVHAYAGTAGQVTLTARCCDRHVQVVIADRGNGMLPRRPSDGLGLGLPLMSTLTDRLEITATPDGSGTEVNMMFEFETRAASGVALASGEFAAGDAVA